MFYFLLTLLVLLLLFQLSPFQKLIAEKALSEISDHTEYYISLTGINISWLDNAEFKNLLVHDLAMDTMFYSKSLSVNYDLIRLIRDQALKVDEIIAEDLLVHFIKYDSTGKLNLTDFLQRISKNKGDSAGLKEANIINVDRIHLGSLRFRLSGQTKNPPRNKPDFSQLDFDIPLLDLSGFQLHADTITGVMNHFSGVEHFSGLAIEELRTVFRLSNSSMSLDDLLLRTPHSSISDSLEFYYNGLDDFGHFVDSVSFVFHFEDTKLSIKDIELLTGFNELKSDLTLDGLFWGTVGDFNIEDARVGFGSSTYFKGGVSCFGLPNLNRTFILADIIESHLLPEDLEPYVGEVKDNLNQMGRIDFSGSFAGFLNDFVAKGNFRTDQGSVYSDINLKIPKDLSLTYYKGNLELDDVNVGAFLKSDLIQNVGLKGSIEGKGITADNADFNLEALFYSSSLYGYIYDTIIINGAFQKNFFKSQVAIHDPNCQLEGIAELDLRDNNQFLDLDIFTKSIQADKLNLTDRNISGEGRIDLMLSNFSVDQFDGELRMDSALIKIDEKQIPLNSIGVESYFTSDSLRKFILSMPGVVANISGSYKVTSLVKDVGVLARGYANKLQLLDSLNLDSVANLSSGELYKVDAKIDFHEVNPYFDSLQLPIHISKGSSLEVSFRQGKSSNLSLFYYGDSLILNGNRFEDPIIEVNGSSKESLSSILTNFIFESSNQFFRGVPETRNLLLEGIWSDNTINFTSLIEQPSSSTNIRLESQLKLYQDSIMFKIMPSDIIILDDEWNFNPSNSIVIRSDNIMISNFEIYDQSEAINISGNLSSTQGSTANILVEDLNMNKANLFTEVNFSGFLNGNFVLFRDAPDEPMSYDGEILLKNLQYDDITIGDISGSSNWNPVNKSIYSVLEVNRDNFKSIQVKGYYYPTEIDEQFDYTIQFNQADLKIAGPFVKEIVSGLAGYANGQLKLNGNFNSPQILGDFSLEKGSCSIIYLNTLYSYSGDVSFDSNSLNFLDFNLTDRKGNSAALSGKISHNSFNNFLTDITLNIRNFELLNTTALDNELYYGSAYGTGMVNIAGPFNDLRISADVKTDPNTRFFIPVSESTNTSQEDFIQFVNLSDTSNVLVKDEDTSIKGVTLDFDIEITPDSYCELIFDIKKGDIIRGRGRGNIKLSLNTDGAFDMFGPLEITEGAYNFTLSNLINKEFDIVPGSRITWYGDPYDASLDLEATYLQRASFEELEVLSERNESEVSNRVPIDAVLFIDGSILTPEIGFGLRLENESDANTDNIGKLSRINNDEQELRRQFISLLFLRRFSPYESFSLGTGAGIGGSVSEILSNQVSYLVSQIDENLEIEVDLTALDEESFNTFQLRFAYTFLDGRLKVTRGGGFGSDQDQNRNVLNDIVGNWSVEYSLTKDGRLRAKVFRNTNERLITNDGNLSQETGISLRFVHSFNDLTELLTSRREEAIRRKKEKERDDSSSDSVNLNPSIN